MSSGAWARLQRRYCLTLLRFILLEADTATVRAGLALASFLFSLFMAYHAAAGTGLFQRPAYALMALVGGEWMWAGMFALHAAGGLWRLVDATQRDRAGLIVNGFGFFLWLYSTLCLNFALGLLLPTTASEWTMILASGWAFFRTGWNERVTS